MYFFLWLLLWLTRLWVWDRRFLATYFWLIPGDLERFLLSYLRNSSATLFFFSATFQCWPYSSIVKTHFSSANKMLLYMLYIYNILEIVVRPSVFWNSNIQSAATTPMIPFLTGSWRSLTWWDIPLFHSTDHLYNIRIHTWLNCFSSPSKHLNLDVHPVLLDFDFQWEILILINRRDKLVHHQPTIKKKIISLSIATMAHYILEEKRTVIQLKWF